MVYPTGFAAKSKANEAGLRLIPTGGQKTAVLARGRRSLAAKKAASWSHVLPSSAPLRLRLDRIFASLRISVEDLDRFRNAWKIRCTVYEIASIQTSISPSESFFPLLEALNGLCRFPSVIAKKDKSASRSSPSYKARFSRYFCLFVLNAI